MQKIDLPALRTINGLELPKAMSDEQLAEYNDELNEFIDTLSDKSYELTKNFIVRDYVIFRKKLLELSGVLKRLRANGAVKSCDELLDALTEQKKTDIDTLLGKFIAELNTLSIDVQLAQYKSGEQNKERRIQATQARKHVLAVDDEPVILNALKGVIDGEKYKFSGLTSGKAALHYMETHTPPDLLIVDLEMPVMDGYTFTQIVIEQGYYMPIIILTGNATRKAVIKALRAGATDFLVKPINENLILYRLGCYLG